MPEIRGAVVIPGGACGLGVIVGAVGGSCAVALAWGGLSAAGNGDVHVVEMVLGRIAPVLHLVGLPGGGDVLLPPDQVLDVEEIAVRQQVVLDAIAQLAALARGVVRDHDVHGAARRVIGVGINRPPPADGLHVGKALRHGPGHPDRVDLQVLLGGDLVRIGHLPARGRRRLTGGRGLVGGRLTASRARVRRSVEPRLRIGLAPTGQAPALPHLEVQVGAGGLAVVADLTDVLSCGNGVAHLHGHSVVPHMAVDGRVGLTVDGVVDDDPVAEPARGAGGGHHAWGHRVHGRAA